MIAAAVGLVYFWPIICNVYATPTTIIAVYNMGPKQSIIELISGVSNINADITERIPAVTNCTNDNLRPSVLSA